MGLSNKSLVYLHTTLCGLALLGGMRAMASGYAAMVAFVPALILLTSLLFWMRGRSQDIAPLPDARQRDVAARDADALVSWYKAPILWGSLLSISYVVFQTLD